MPNTAKGGGISRKIYSSSDRKKMKEIINDIELPKKELFMLSMTMKQFATLCSGS